MLGEQGQAAFTILNEGALQVQFEISSGGQVSIHSYNAALWCPCRALACKNVSAELLLAMFCCKDTFCKDTFCSSDIAFKCVSAELQSPTLHDSPC